MSSDASTDVSAVRPAAASVMGPIGKCPPSFGGASMTFTLATVGFLLGYSLTGECGWSPPFATTATPETQWAIDWATTTKSMTLEKQVGV